MYKFSMEQRVPAIDVTLVSQGKACPYDERGRMQRIAQRSDVWPYRWYPIGFRCTQCGTLFLNDKSIDVSAHYAM